MQRWYLGCFALLPAQSGTCYILALSLFYYILVIFMSNQLLEMSKTTAHLHSIRLKVLLRPAHLPSRSFIELHTVIGFKIRLRATLICSFSLLISIKWFPLVIVFDQKRWILMISKCLLKFVKLLLFYPTFHCLHILPQFNLQIRKL